MSSLSEISLRITQCSACPRLRAHCTKISQEKKREFRNQEYWGKPVPGFGDPNASLWILGLAPAAHGANRTGRMFTGDSSGQWLYRALHEVGLANRPEATSKEDGLCLRGVFISAAARCAPPDNKPTRNELFSCSSYLDEEFEALSQIKIILALGAIAFDASLQLLARKGIEISRPHPRFSHNALFSFGKYELLSSYHPSRQNTQTGKLTAAMWKTVFVRAKRRMLENHAAREGDLV